MKGLYLTLYFVTVPSILDKQGRRKYVFWLVVSDVSGCDCLVNILGLLLGRTLQSKGMVEESFFFKIIFTELYISIHSALFHTSPLQPFPIGLSQNKKQTKKKKKLDIVYQDDKWAEI